MTFWIADICSNHNQDLDRTKKLIDAAKDSGCNAVKFQLFSAYKLYSPEFKDKIKEMQKCELPFSFIVEISKHCRKNDIKFGCTPFDLKAVDILYHHIDFYKIGSYETNWHTLIKKVIDTGKPWMLSTGMMRLIQVNHLMEQEFIKKNPPEVLFRCNSTYPAKAENCNLDNIRFCKNYIANRKTDIGWSDHTNEPGVIHKAVHLGAKYCEFHLDLEDRKGYESKIGHCWTPSEIKKVIHDVSIGEKAEFGINQNYDSEAKKWRTDPSDGYRPLKQYRKELLNG